MGLYTWRTYIPPPIILQKKLLNGPLKVSNGDAFMEGSQTKVPPPYVIVFLSKDIFRGLQAAQKYNRQSP